MHGGIERNTPGRTRCQGSRADAVTAFNIFRIVANFAVRLRPWYARLLAVLVAQTRLQLQRCLGRQGQGRCDIPMPRQQRLVPVHRDLGPFMPDGIVVGRVARPMLGNVPDAGEQAADLFAVAGLCHQLSGIDAIDLQSATARQAEFMPPVLSGGVLQMIYSGRIMGVAVAKKMEEVDGKEIQENNPGYASRCQGGPRPQEACYPGEVFCERRIEQAPKDGPSAEGRLLHSGWASGMDSEVRKKQVILKKVVVRSQEVKS